MSYEFVLVGISHRTANVATRERASLEGEELRLRLNQAMALEYVREAWVVSTCNRTEVLVVSETETHQEDKDLKARLRQLFFAELPFDCVYDYRGTQAIIHVFRVTSGLDSLVLGEGQIMAQVKESLALARQEGTVSKRLEPLLQQALTSAKRIRTHTSVGNGTLSVARAGIDIAEQVFGGFSDNSVVVLGAGETGRLAAQSFKERGVRDMCIVNRTLFKAEDVAQELGCRSAGLNALSKEVGEADILVAALGGAPDSVRPEHLPVRRLRNRDQPLVVIDLSVPRAVSSSVSTLSNVITYNLDDLQKVVDQNRQERQEAAEEAAPILLADVHKFLGLRTYASYSPQIKRARERFESIREQVLDEIAEDSATPREMKLAHRLTAQLLDVAFDVLKETARESVAQESIDEAYQRFLEDQN